MSVIIQIESEKPHLEANLVPCHVHYTGPANTTKYFEPTRELDEAGNHISYFRGCRLVGEEMKFRSHTGYVITKSTTDNGDHIDSTYRNIGQFDGVINYGHEGLDDNQWGLINEWDDLSRLIHE